MTGIDTAAAFGLLDAVEAFFCDIRHTLHGLDPSDADSVYDVRRDCHIRIQNIERKLDDLKKTIGPDPLARPSVLDEHQVTLSEQKAEDLIHRLLVAENACGDVRFRMEAVDIAADKAKEWKTAYDDMWKCLAAAVLNIGDVSKALR